MEMRTLVLTFPLFSEYDLISKRKREREGGTQGERREEGNREEEDAVTVAVTVQGTAREGNSEEIFEETEEGGGNKRVEKPNGKARSLGEERLLLSIRTGDDTEEEDERNERITSRTQRSKSTFFTRSGRSSVLILREKKRKGRFSPCTFHARDSQRNVAEQTLDNLRRGVTLLRRRIK